MANFNYTTNRYSHPDDDGLPEKSAVETLRDNILKSCFNNQMRTDISLEDQKKREINFVKVQTQDSVGNLTSGLTSLSQFNSFTDKNECKEILLSAGMTLSEVTLMLEEEDSSVDTSSKSSLAQIHKLSILEKLNERLNIINENDANIKETFNGSIPLSRKDYIEECSYVTSSGLADHLTNCLVKLEPKTFKNEELGEQLRKLEKDLMIKVEKTGKCKKNHTNVQPTTSKKIKVTNQIQINNKSLSLWDMTEPPKINSSFNKEIESNYVEIDIINKDTKIVAKKKIATNTTKPFVLVLNSSELIPVEIIRSNKISLENLKKMNKFENYETGDISQTLYLKNLPNNIKPSELSSVFGHWECSSGPYISYRILNGKMRGQAFITFKNTDMAKMALEMCNGFIIKDKPIVIAYSKK